MSSLTSIGINKNKKVFAPKNSKRKVRSATKSNQDTEPLFKSAEPLSKPDSQSTQTITVESLSKPFIDAAIKSADPKTETLTQEELAINSSSKRKRRHAHDNTESDSNTQTTNVEPLLKEEVSTPHFDDILDTDDDIEPKEEELRSNDRLKKMKGKRPAKKKKAKEVSKPVRTAISIGVGIPNPSSSPNELSTTMQRESGSDKDEDIPKKRHKFAYRLVENMKTLDDITNDPANMDDLEKPMSHFTKDIDGIVSKAFKEMEALREAENKKKEAKKTMSSEELEELQRKEAEEENVAAEKRKVEKQKQDEQRKKDAENHVLQESSNAVQVRIVNGEIVLDTDTLVVERQVGQSQLVDESMEVVEETNLTRKVNSNTYSKRKQSSRWDAFETNTFYEYLSQFGTDFEMIAKMMPGRTRNQIRLKFNREEKASPEKVTEYLISRRKPMDLERFKEVSGIDLETVPDDFHELQIA